MSIQVLTKNTIRFECLPALLTLKGPQLRMHPFDVKRQCIFSFELFGAYSTLVRSDGGFVVCFQMILPVTTYAERFTAYVTLVRSFSGVRAQVVCEALSCGQRLAAHRALKLHPRRPDDAVLTVLFGLRRRVGSLRNAPRLLFYMRSGFWNNSRNIGRTAVRSKPLI